MYHTNVCALPASAMVYTSSASKERNESFIHPLCQVIQSSTLFQRSQYGSKDFCTSDSRSYSVASFANSLSSNVGHDDTQESPSKVAVHEIVSWPRVFCTLFYRCLEPVVVFGGVPAHSVT